MLNEFTEIPKVRIALLESSFFYEPDSETRYIPNLETIRKLSYGMSAFWILNFVAHKEEPWVDRLVRVCSMLGVNFIRINRVSTIEEFKKIASISDVAYTPTLLKTLPVNFLLKQPPSAQVMLEVICHFSQCIEPFNTENYYKVVEHYGP